MTQNTNPERITRFYQEPIVLMMLAILGASFIMGIVILTSAIRTADGVVVDNFYKDGRSHYMRLEEDIRANELNLNALARSQDQQILLQLTGDLEELPDQLWLKFISRTNQRFDYFVTLDRQEGNLYQGQLTQELTHPQWLVQLQPKDEDNEGFLWRLHAEIFWPLVSPMVLRPAIWN